MAQWYSYYDQDSYPREPSIRVYSYQPRPSTEGRADDLQRYPGVYKLFNNNRSSHGEPDVMMGQPHVHSRVSHGSADPVSSQSRVGDQRDAHGPRQKVKFVERGGETAGGDRNREKGESVDDAANGFITWKRKNLQMCKTFGE